MFGRLSPPRTFSALPPSMIHEASPKAISRRTSYLRVRLEFLPYPQLIPAPFSTDVWFGPPWNFTSTSTWPWIGHPVSGLRHATSALFRLAFASASNLQFLTSLHNATRRSVLQKVRNRTSIVLLLLVNTGFQVLFHSPPGVLFTFPSRYYALSVTISALSVTISYLGLEGGPPCFPPDFSCPAVLWCRLAA